MGINKICLYSSAGIKLIEEIVTQRSMVLGEFLKFSNSFISRGPSFPSKHRVNNNRVLMETKINQCANEIVGAYRLSTVRPFILVTADLCKQTSRRGEREQQTKLRTRPQSTASTVWG